MPIVESTESVKGESMTLYIETDIAAAGDPTAVYNQAETRAEARKLLRAAQDVFGDGLELARSCAMKVQDSLGQMQDAVRPNEFQVQLAIKLDTEVGVPMITKLGAEAQMQVTMKWVSSLADG
jgi:hypothetical protein